MFVYMLCVWKRKKMKTELSTFQKQLKRSVVWCKGKHFSVSLTTAGKRMYKDLSEKIKKKKKETHWRVYCKIYMKSYTRLSLWPPQFKVACLVEGLWAALPFQYSNFVSFTWFPFVLRSLEVHSLCSSISLVTKIAKAISHNTCKFRYFGYLIYVWNVLWNNLFLPIFQFCWFTKDFSWQLKCVWNQWGWGREEYPVELSTEKIKKLLIERPIKYSVVLYISTFYVMSVFIKWGMTAYEHS